MRTLRRTILGLLLASWASSAAADVLVLRDGRRLNGILSNSELVRREPGAFRHVSFLIGTGPESILRRFATAEIGYILIEDPERTFVIDFVHASGTSAQWSEPHDRGSWHLAFTGGATWVRFQGRHSQAFHDFRPGMTFGVGLTGLNNEYGGVRLEALYLQKGARGESPDGSQQAEFRMHYIEVPFLLVVRLPIEAAAITGCIGPTLSVHLQSEAETTIRSYPPTSSVDNISNQMSDLDVGLKFGLGLELPVGERQKLVLQGGYLRTFSDFARDSVPLSWKHEVVTLEAGISFALGAGGNDSGPRSWREELYEVHERHGIHTRGMEARP